MAHFAYTRPSGTWSTGYVPVDTDFGSLDVKTYKAVNGDEGGTWAPSAPIIVGGSGLQIPNGATWTVLSGGTFNVASGGEVDVASGAFLNVAGGGTMNLAGLLQAAGAGAKISTTFGARLEHNDNDYPGLGSGHTGRTRVYRTPPLAYGYVNADWAYEGYPSVLVGGATGVGVACYMPVHNGATLASVKLFFAIDHAHASLPTYQVGVGVIRYDLATGVAETLRTAGDLFLTAANGAAYDASTSLTYTTDRYNVIDTSTYGYQLWVFDENGSNAWTNNKFYGFELTYTGITDLRFA